MARKSEPLLSIAIKTAREVLHRWAETAARLPGIRAKVSRLGDNWRQATFFALQGEPWAAESKEQTEAPSLTSQESPPA